MLYTLQTLAPVFLVIALGYMLAWRGFFGKAFLDDLNRLVYWVCLPSLMIGSTDRATGLSGEVVPVFAAYCGATLLVTALAYVWARLLGLKRWQYGTFIQGSFRGNLAFIGLPILSYALRGEDPQAASSIIAQGVLVFAPVMILYNVLSVAVLTQPDGRGLRGMGMESLRSMARNPLILAALAGLVLYLTPGRLPGPVSDTLDFLGRVAAPAALLCVGGGIALSSMEGRYRSASCMAVLKVFGTPLLAWLVSRPFGLSESSTLILMIFAASPTAVASYVMAKQMNGDGAMASGAIVLSTLLSVVSLAAVVAIF